VGFAARLAFAAPRGCRARRFEPVDKPVEGR
jgi:hypothetical protein